MPMNFFKRKGRIRQTPRELLEQVQLLEERYRKLAEELKEFKQDMDTALTKVGVIRFNPFQEIGGDQSFSIALLNQKNNGVVITSHYTREGNRVYAKPIKNGVSEYPLSVEEKEVLEQTLRPAESPNAKNSK